MKSRMPEIVEPKQLIQSRVLVKRARLTVKRGAARPNGKSKPPQSQVQQPEVEIVLQKKAKRPVGTAPGSLGSQLRNPFGSSPLAQAAVSVQNPPSGSQTCFPGGWVR